MSFRPIFHPNFDVDIRVPFDDDFHCKHFLPPPPLFPFDDFFTPFRSNMMHRPMFPMLDQLATHNMRPKPKWNETAEAHELRVELPGFNKHEVKVQVKGGFLKIRGKKHVEKQDRHDNKHQLERSQEEFSSSVSLPENCRVDDVRSSFENGVLIVKVPKRDVGRSHTKNIEVRGSNSGYNRPHGSHEYYN